MKRSHVAGWVAVLLVALAVAQLMKGTGPGGDRGSGAGAGSGGGVGPRVTKRSLGVQIKTHDEPGVIVAAVLPGGAGEKAGLRAGDIILKVEGESITDHKPIHARLNALRADEVMTLEVQRLGGAVETVVVAFASGGGYELTFARGLIRQAANQLIDLRRSDGLWPHYQVERRPSVAVTALAAYALARAREDLDELGLEELKSTMLVLATKVGKDGGLQDPAQVVAHRVYANGLYAMALGEDPTSDPKRLDGVARWLAKAQVQEEHGFDPIDSRYGGWSYYDDYVTLRTDMSTARFALQGFAAAELDPNAPAWSRAGFFLDELQNHALITAPADPLHATELDLRDGGFCFLPRAGKAGVRELGDDMLVGRSYGTATADGLLGLLALRGIDRRARADESPPRDPRVLAALRWLASRYSLDAVPGFDEASPWRQGLYFYFLAAQAEAFHRAGVWELRDPRGGKNQWAAELVRKLGDLHGRSGGQFTSGSGLMHEDAPGIACAFAIIALTAARDRLALGKGSVLEAGAPPPGPPRFVEDSMLLPPAEGRGRELMRGALGCFGCHRDDRTGNGPSLVGVAEVYLQKHGSEPAARAELKRWLRDPQPARSLLGGEWPAKMPPLLPEACSDQALDDILTFLLACKGARPVSELR